MALYLIRHAHAGERSAWDEDDRGRPLSSHGQEQALAIAQVLAGLPADRRPDTVVSSPATRCVQTVTPTAAALGTEVILDARLAEGAGPDQVRAFLDDVADRTVCCSHGDVIPQLLRRLNELGMQTDHHLVWQKASMWEIERGDDGWGFGRYHQPPDRTR